MKTQDAIQEKLVELIDLMDEFENPEERILATLNSIITLTQNSANSVFEFFGLLDEAKYLYREEILGGFEDDDDEEDEDDEEEEDYDNHFHSRN